MHGTWYCACMVLLHGTVLCVMWYALLTYRIRLDVIDTTREQVNNNM